MDSAEVHISSLVVHANPAGLRSVKDQILRLPGAEIRGESETGKLVVVLESDSQTQITDTIEQINEFRHVLGTALVFHQIESPAITGGESP